MATPTAPTAAEFQRALRDIRPLAPHHVRLLRAHYMAPGHTATATELAVAVGYDGYTAVNLHYGKFAVRVCEALGVPPDFNVLLASALPGEPDGHLQLVLAPALVEALHELCWSWAT